MADRIESLPDVYRYKRSFPDFCEERSTVMTGGDAGRAGMAE